MPDRKPEPRQRKTPELRLRKRMGAALMLSLVWALVWALIPTQASAQEEQIPGGSFQDDNTSVHEADIEALAAAGITKGCNPPANDWFCPQRSISRGEMAAFLARTLELAPADHDVFRDDDGSLFEDDIERLAAAGVTKGCNPPDNDRFCPDDPVTRGQMAAFLVRAYDYPAAPPGRFVDTAGSVFQSDIERLASAGVTKGCNPPDNDRFCPDQPVTRAQMASFLVRAEGLTPITVPDGVSIGFEPFVSGLGAPIHLTAPEGDDRVFVVERPGRIRVVTGGVLAPTPFLDIQGRVDDSGGEMGLLSLAFHPDFATNGRFFVAYSGPLQAGGAGHHTEYVSEFQVSSDPDVASTSERIVLAVDQPAANHNGGHLLFGPDGLLYVALGDGGGGGDRFGNGQDAATLLGSILRLDVDGAEPYAIPPDNPFVGLPGADEVWAIGLRNPWRIWFDRGLLYVADVGQDRREEVSVVPAEQGGSNFGWNVQEGSACFAPSSGCDPSGKVQPLIELSHDSGACSITGGVVPQSTSIPQMRGRYLFADLCLGQIEMILTDGAEVVERSTVPVGTHRGIWSFGTDAAGNAYAVLGGSGSVWKFVPI